MKQVQGKREKLYSKVVLVALTILTLLGCIKAVLISLDIDECYAIAVGYRLASGQRLFSQLWESHQLGGVFLAPFMKLFLLLSGSTEYIVLYCRALGIIVHGLVGLFLYKTIRPKMGSHLAALLFFLHMNFLPKWVQIPEFEVQQYWFSLLGGLLLYRYFVLEKSEGKRGALWLFLAGVCLVCQMYSYPTLIMLYPLLVAGIFLLEKEGKRICAVITFSVGALVSGGIFLLYLFSYMNPAQLLHFMEYSFLDTSHTTMTTAVKWNFFKDQFLDICSLFLSAIAICLVLYYGVLLIAKCLHKPFSRDVRSNLPYRVCTLIAVLGIWQAVGCLFGNENQFFMQWRYFAIGVAGILLALYTGKGQKDKKVILFFFLLPGILTLLSVMIMTNMDLNTSMSKLFICVIGTLLLLPIGEETESDFGRKNIPMQLAIFAFLAGLLVCRLIQIRVTGCGEVTVLAPLERIDKGPAKGVYMLADTATVLEKDYEELVPLLSKEDNLLYVGNENLVYLWSDATVATPSTQGTTSYNEIFPAYYEEHPELMPTIIAVDLEMAENPVYYNSPKNQILYDWIEKEYGYTQELDLSYMHIYMKR